MGPGGSRSSEIERRFDQLTLALANGVPRRTVLKAGVALGGALLGSMLPVRLSSVAADPGGGNSDPAKLCQTLFPPGPERGKCVSSFAQTPGLLSQCANPLTICVSPAGVPACCPAGQGCCGGTVAQLGACTPLNTTQNCGVCGITCLAGEACCNAVCTPLNTVSNCGACGSACTGGQGCCNGTCTDLTTTANCGACGNACATGQACCNGVCTDLSTVANCGSCGNVCAAGQGCCNGSCTDLTTAANCGTCGNACAAAQVGRRKVEVRSK